MQLDKPVILSGTTSRFKGDGRKLGYPTANLSLPTTLADGVYFGFADLGKWTNHPAIIFIGVPTTMGETERRVEAYLIDIPDKDYYDIELTIRVVYYYRQNQKFTGAQELMEAMKQDLAVARQWFKDNVSSGSDRP